MITIGVLGTGFLGKALFSQTTLGKSSWWTFRSSPPDNFDSVESLQFDWANKETWDNLPRQANTLVLTIPPITKDPAREAERVREWGRWMEANRPDLQRLIYISTTGVYPNLDGEWDETREFSPDAPRGWVRLETERALDKSFDLIVVRPGGIYGPGRNLATRISAGKKISLSPRRIHRIHVFDLARIVDWAANHPNPPKMINAVDNEASTMKQTVDWLVDQSFYSDSGEIILYENENSFFNQPIASPFALDRKISNCLLKRLGFQLNYPTFREGLRQCLTDSP